MRQKYHVAKRDSFVACAIALYRKGKRIRGANKRITNALGCHETCEFKPNAVWRAGHVLGRPFPYIDRATAARFAPGALRCAAGQKGSIS